MLYSPIIIDNWDNGIASSAYKGIKGSHYEMVGLDYRSEEGVLQLAYKMTATASTIRCKATNFLASTTTELFAIGDLTGSPHIYKTTDSGVTWTQKYPIDEISIAESSAGIKGAEIWRGYIFLAGQSGLHVYNPSSESDLVNWKTWTGDEVDDTYHPMHPAKGDGSLYIGAGRFLSRLSETAGDTFDPNDSTSYSWTVQALDLPKGFRIRSIEEIGNYLILGCWKKDAAGHISAVAVIYPWNYILQLDSHEGPISVRRYGGVSALLNINNKIFSWVGTRGEIFYYTGTNLKKIKKLPFNPGVEVEPGAVKSNFNDIPIFGIDNKIDGVVPHNGRGGVYSYGTVEEGTYPWSLNLEYPLSPTQSAAYQIGAVATAGATDNILLASWYNSTLATYGIDYLNTARYLNSGAYFTTLLMRAGTAKQKQIIDGFQIILDGALSSGQIVNLSYRRKVSDSWTTIKIRGNTYSMSFAEVGAKNEIYIPFSIREVVNLQLKCELTTTNADSNSNIKIREIRIQ